MHISFLALTNMSKILTFSFENMSMVSSLVSFFKMSLILDVTKGENEEILVPFSIMFFTVNYTLIDRIQIKILFFVYTISIFIF